jgi:hypothetical protein
MMDVVQRHSSTFFERVKQQFFYMVAMATMFTLIGWGLPQIYYQYLDKTQYYSLSQPVSVDKPVYEPCDSVNIIAKRVALAPLVVDIDNSLILVETATDSSKLLRVYELPRRENLVIQETDGAIVSAELVLPCTLVDGTYFWQGAVEYEHNGKATTYIYATDQFEVKNASEAAQLSPARARSLQSTPKPAPTQVPASTQQPQQQSSQPSQQTINVVNQQPAQQPQQSQQPQHTPAPTQQPSVIETVGDTVGDILDGLL